MSQPPRWEVPLAWPWRVTWHTLHVPNPDTLAPGDEAWGWFTESLLLAEGPGGLGLEIGWYPDADPRGRFVVSLLPPDPNGGFNWDAPLEQSEIRDVGQAVDDALRWAARYAEPLPDDPSTLAARLSDHHPSWVAPTLARLLSPDRRAAMAAMATELPALAPYLARPEDEPR
jgi:hypothetical protein